MPTIVSTPNSPKALDQLVGYGAEEDVVASARELLARLQDERSIDVRTEFRRGALARQALELVVTRGLAFLSPKADGGGWVVRVP